MIFRDRNEAGVRLAQALGEYKDSKDTVLLALPRGGVVVAYEIARALGLPLDIIVPRKIGHPQNPEYAIGAVCEDGTTLMNEYEAKQIDKKVLDKIIKEERAEAERRLKVYRGGRVDRDLKNKTVILVDDGVATGLTMRAAIKSAHNLGAKKVIVAVPHGAVDSLERLEEEADKVIALERPYFYGAVGAFYENFEQTTDEEVIQKLKILPL